MKASEAHVAHPEAVVWRLALTGAVERGKCTINLSPFHSKGGHISSVFADTGDPKHNWLWDIINTARMGDRGTAVAYPPPTYIVWFLTTQDNQLIDILEVT